MEELANTVSAAVASAGYAGDMLGALYVMAAWTAITWIIMTAVRIPAMNAAGLTPDDAKHTVNLNTLQGTPRQLGDNYNHLFEVPVIFYAVVLAADGDAIAQGRQRRHQGLGDGEDHVEGPSATGG